MSGNISTHDRELLELFLTSFPRRVGKRRKRLDSLEELRLYISHNEGKGECTICIYPITKVSYYKGGRIERFSTPYLHYSVSSALLNTVCENLKSWRYPFIAWEETLDSWNLITTHRSFQVLSYLGLTYTRRQRRVQIPFTYSLRLGRIPKFLTSVSSV